jgi:ABC-type protease/lipase transport system fused ATPase/permease subunit
MAFLPPGLAVTLLALLALLALALPVMLLQIYDHVLPNAASGTLLALAMAGRRTWRRPPGL